MKTQRKRWFLYSEKELTDHVLFDHLQSPASSAQSFYFTYDLEMLCALGYKGERIQEQLLTDFDYQTDPLERMGRFEMLLQGLALNLFDFDLEAELEYRNTPPEEVVLKRQFHAQQTKYQNYFPSLFYFIKDCEAYKTITVENYLEIRRHIASVEKDILELLEHAKKNNLGTGQFTELNLHRRRFGLEAA